jgi:hypothetical protein
VERVVERVVGRVVARAWSNPIWSGDMLQRIALHPRVLLIAIASLSIAGCSDSGTGPVRARELPYGTALKLNVVHDSLFYGKSLVLSVSDSADTAAVEPKYQWTSSDTSVAVVDSTGALLAVGPGSARITVERTGARDSMRLGVVLRRADGGHVLQWGAEGGGANGALHCAIGADGGMYCQSRSTADSLRTFQRMPGAAGRQFVSASTSLHAQCALDTSGAIVCWGSNARGIFARTGSVPTDTGGYPLAIALRFSQMQHGGHAQTCGVALQDSLTYCWGHNDFFQLGRDTDRADSPVPTPVDGITKTGYVATENFGTCALTVDSTAYCSGISGLQAGTGISGFLRSMHPVVNGHKFASLHHGDTFVCGVQKDGRAMCWGDNRGGTVGKGDSVDLVLEPTPVATTVRFRKLVTVYRQYACGVSTADDLYCWGNFPPTSVSLRMGSRRFAPVHIAPGVKFRDVTGSLCGITLDGRALCW